MLVFAALFPPSQSKAESTAQPLNLLIITVDDMSCDSVGAFGCKVPGTTPNIDALAARGMKFEHAHVVVGNCMPSRNVMWSGRYPHHNGVQGFNPLPKESVKYPVLGDLVKAGGWLAGIRGKVPHSTPYVPYAWDLVLDQNAAGKKVHVKDAASYGASLKQGMASASEAGKPFCLLMNVSDPHKPFYAEGKRGQMVEDPHVPSRVYTAEEIAVPGFLPDDPAIRQELALYYSSVRRADDAVGAMLQALKESGQEANTAIVFLSDHGMPLPFAKTQMYHHSSRTPLLVVWPGVTQPGLVEAEAMVSTVDLLPTLLDMLKLPQPEGLDGRSFAPLLKGEKQAGRDMVFKEYHENSGGQMTPMRAVQTREWLYVFNPWSNGKRVMSGATAGTETCRRMRVLAKTDEAVAARVEVFDHRTPEEAYEVKYDADALSNLTDNPAHAGEVGRLRQAMEDWMQRTGDPLLEVFRKRNDATFREAWMQDLERTMRKGRRKAAPEGGQAPRKKAAQMKSTPPNQSNHAAGDLIELSLPPAVAAGATATIRVRYNLHADLGERPLLVTLKDGHGKRVERKNLKAAGEGMAEVAFDIPTSVPGGKVSFAALLGENINEALDHVQSAPIPLK